jgi:hypothetical protein
LCGPHCCFLGIFDLHIRCAGRLQQSARELAVVMNAIERRDAEGGAQSLMIYVRNAGEAALSISMRRRPPIVA